jgi:hypothetical protein
LNQLEVGSNPRIDQYKNNTYQDSDNQVFHDGIYRTLTLSFVAGAVTARSRHIRRIVGSTARHWVARTPARLRFFVPAIDAARRQTTTMHRFFENPCDLL